MDEIESTFEAVAEALTEITAALVRSEEMFKQAAEKTAELEQRLSYLEGRVLP